MMIKQQKADNELYRLITKNSQRVFITRAEVCRAVGKDKKTIAPLLAPLEKFRIPRESKEISYKAKDVYKALEACKIYE